MTGLEDGIYRVDISAALNAKGQVPLSLNSRMHWAAHAAAVARVKAVTRNALMAAAVPPMQGVHVQLHYRPASNRFRDVDNIVATLKPAMDALHQRDESRNAPVPFDPIVPGDDPRFVTWEPPILHPWERGRAAALWLVLIPWAADEAAQ
jgi:crossover junction endodeoxyribonuclease RusA